jgi:hypothetical protein
VKLRAYYRQLTDGILESQKKCGRHFQRIRHAFLRLGGKRDGSNREEVFPKLYKHFGNYIETKSVIPFFEDYVEYQVQAAKVLERLARCEKKGRDQKMRIANS